MHQKCLAAGLPRPSGRAYWWNDTTVSKFLRKWVNLNTTQLHNTTISLPLTGRVCRSYSQVMLTIPLCEVCFYSPDLLLFVAEPAATKHRRDTKQLCKTTTFSNVNKENLVTIKNHYCEILLPKLCDKMWWRKTHVSRSGPSDARIWHLVAVIVQQPKWWSSTTGLYVAISASTARDIISSCNCSTNFIQYWTIAVHLHF